MSNFIVKRGEYTISESTRSTISMRYHRITKAVNLAFWNSKSDDAHSFYVGSYGRGTAIDTSDIDVLIELPYLEYEHFTFLAGNGQSRLLQAVKDSIIDTYPNTLIKGDGQVVVVSFSDGMVFEVLPAFKEMRIGTITYKYPDTHMGGNWLSTNPKAEQAAMKNKNDISNGLLYDTCKHIRYIRDNCYSSCLLSGILIDSFVYEAIERWRFVSEGENTTKDRVTYEQALLRKYNEISLYGCITPRLNAPGSRDVIDGTKGWETLGKVLNCMV